MAEPSHKASTLTRNDQYFPVRGPNLVKLMENFPVVSSFFGSSPEQLWRASGTELLAWASEKHPGNKDVKN